MSKQIFDEPAEGDTLTLELIAKLGAAGAEIIKGIYASPWTGVPFTLIVLSQLDPKGRLTLMFLNNLGTFLTALATAGGKVASDIANAIKGGGFLEPISDDPPPPGVTAPVGHAILAGPFNDKVAAAFAIQGYAVAASITGNTVKLVRGTDGNFYIVDPNKPIVPVPAGVKSPVPFVILGGPFDFLTGAFEVQGFAVAASVTGHRVLLMQGTDGKWYVVDPDNPIKPS